MTRSASAVIWRLLPAMILLFILSGCASFRVGMGNAAIELPPVTIIGDPTGRRSDIYDAYDLFDRADKAFVLADWPRAEKLYQLLLAKYPTGEVTPLGRYNLGLVYERTQQWEKALRTYNGFGDNPGKGLRIEEVRLRKAVCLSRLGRYEPAQQQLEMILRQFGVPPLEYNEARARLGIAYFRVGDEILAEHHLRPALDVYERNAARGVMHARAAYAEGYFALGEIDFARFRAIELVGDENALARALGEKADAFVAARNYYTLAIRTYEPEWVVASLFRVGLGYELFYEAVLAAPLPGDLTAGEQKEYRQKLREKLQPVLNKALQAYRRNLELAGDFHVETQFVEQTRKRYATLSRNAQQD